MVFKLYPSTYCLMQCSCFNCSDFRTYTFYDKIRITTFKCAL